MLREAMVLAAALVAAVPAHAQVCFTRDASARLPFKVFQQAPPPRDDGHAAYPYHPITASASMNIDALAASRATGVDRYFFQWANRCVVPGGQGFGTAGKPCGWNPKGNIVRGSGDGAVRSFFSTIAKADACTLAQADFVLGARDDVVQKRVQAAGLRFALDPAAARALDPAILDICVMPEGRLPAGGTGIVLDYEVQDGRTPDHTKTFLESFAALVHSHGKKAVLFTNPLDAPTQRYTGVGASNAAALLRAFDHLVIFIWSGNRQKDIEASFRSQWSMLGGGPANKLLVVFELAGTTVEDARVTRRLVLEHKLGGVMFWRNHARQGGDCAEPVNRKIACLVFEDCR